VECDPWSVLPKVWLSIGLPGLEAESTYRGISLDKMPTIPIELGDDLLWLQTYGNCHPGNGLDRTDEFVKPLPPAAAIDLATRLRISLPSSFMQFMTSPELQSRIRSCTDCYFDPGQRIVGTVGAIPGHLLHFLSDSQSCAHWYLHVLTDGRSAVLESPDLYCYEIENSDWMENPACRLERIDLSNVEFYYCSKSFAEFLFRFWIENEIWFAVHVDEAKRPLSALEKAYLGR